MTSASRVADQVVPGVSQPVQPLGVREPDPPPVPTSFRISSNYLTGRPLDSQESLSRIIEKSGWILAVTPHAGPHFHANRGREPLNLVCGAANQMLTRGSMSFGYDERGNQTEKRFKSGRREIYGYSAAGQLASFSTGHLGSDKLKEVERYLYSPDSERVLVEDVQGGQLTHSVWDGPRQIEDFHQVGHGGDAKDVGALYVRDLGGQLLETTAFERRLGVTAHRRPVDDDDHEDNDRDDGPAPAGARLRHVRWTHPDFLGSSSLVTNHRGQVLQRYLYGPFGERLEGDFAKLRFGYTGHRYEPATGHWSSLYRQLDPRAGRWTQRDPIGISDDTNIYQYVANRPLSATDPLGLQIRLVGAPPDLEAVLRSSKIGDAIWCEIDKKKQDVVYTFHDKAQIIRKNPREELDRDVKDAVDLVNGAPENYGISYGISWPSFRGDVYIGSFALLGRITDNAFATVTRSDTTGALRVDRLNRTLNAPVATADRGRRIISVAGTLVHELFHMKDYFDGTIEYTHFIGDKAYDKQFQAMQEMRSY